MIHADRPDPDESWIDAAATRTVRPYAVAGGRTAPAISVDLLSMLAADVHAADPRLGPDHQQILAVCRQPVSLAEAAARVRLPASVTKILVADLVLWGLLRMAPPVSASTAGIPNRRLLERVLHGLERTL